MLHICFLHYLFIVNICSCVLLLFLNPLCDSCNVLFITTLMFLSMISSSIFIDVLMFNGIPAFLYICTIRTIYQSFGVSSSLHSLLYILSNISSPFSLRCSIISVFILSSDALPSFKSVITSFSSSTVITSSFHSSIFYSVSSCASIFSNVSPFIFLTCNVLYIFVVDFSIEKNSF